MFKTGSLLLVSIIAVALMAPPAPSQSRKTTLDEVAADVINLQSYVKQMQTTADDRNRETKAVLDQILARFGAIDSSIQALGKSLEAIKTADDKSYAELQEAKTALNAMKTTLDRFDRLNLGETLQGIESGINGRGGLKDLIKNMQVTESPLPTSRQAYDSAWGLLSQGFYDDAIAELRDFLKAYPKDRRAAKAQLDIGTAYYSQKKWDQAGIEFDLTIQNYPESDVKCTALYKKGQTLVELKQAAEAKQLFQFVVKDCPDLSGLATTALADLAKKPTTPARGGGRGN